MAGAPFCSTAVHSRDHFSTRCCVAPVYTLRTDPNSHAGASAMPTERSHALPPGTLTSTTFAITHAPSAVSASVAEVK